MGENVIQATDEQVDAAKSEEQRHLDAAIRSHLQQRVVLLNIENQALRARVAELEGRAPEPAPESPLDAAQPLDPMLDGAAT